MATLREYFDTDLSNTIKHRPWLTALLARRPTNVAALALANKIARMAWNSWPQGASVGIT
jgi:hypothetical protein